MLFKVIHCDFAQCGLSYVERQLDREVLLVVELNMQCPAFGTGFVDIET